MRKPSESASVPTHARMPKLIDSRKRPKLGRPSPSRATARKISRIARRACVAAQTNAPSAMVMPKTTQSTAASNG